MQILSKKIISFLMAVMMLSMMFISMQASASVVVKSLTTDITLAGEANVPDSTISMPGGWAGMRITVGEKDLVVTHLGRIYAQGSNATHNFFIANLDGSIVKDGIQSVANADAPIDQFLYAEIPGKVTLQANASYYIMSDYWGATDKFYAGSTAVTTDAASIDGIVILGATYDFHAAAGIGWGPLALKYEEEESATDTTSTVSTTDSSTTSILDSSTTSVLNPSTPSVTDPSTISTATSSATNKVVKESIVDFTKSFTVGGEGNVAGSNVKMPAGWAGMRITIGDKDVKVTSLGRWYTPESAAEHNFLIATVDGELVLDYGKAIAKAKTGVKDGFVYGDIEGGIVLKANTTYYIVSDYWGETDKFYSASQQVTTDVATLDGIVILNASNEYDFYEAAGTGWGPLTFRYAMEIPVTGDNSNWLIAVVVMLLSAIAVVILRFCGQKVFVR